MKVVESNESEITISLSFDEIRQIRGEIYKPGKLHRELELAESEWERKLIDSRRQKRLTTFYRGEKVRANGTDQVYVVDSVSLAALTVSVFREDQGPMNTFSLPVDQVHHVKMVWEIID